MFIRRLYQNLKVARYEHEKNSEKYGLPLELSTSISECPAVIHNDVWIGCNSIILKGVELGEGSIVAAGSVVTKSIPAGVMVAGNPAYIVKTLSREII